MTVGRPVGGTVRGEAAVRRPARVGSRYCGLLLLVGGTMAAVLAGAAQERQQFERASPEAVQTATNALGSLEYAERTEAARMIRRLPQAQALPALMQAVFEHGDGFVRFRALVLLTGFNDPRIRDVMVHVLPDTNDRLRAVAYAFFEHHPDPVVLPELLRALTREESEFVRPALIRALAAHGSDPRVRETLRVEVGRGESFFRSAVLEALGDHRAEYALAPLIDVARQGGPLQADAALALGKLGDRRALEVLAALQRTAPRDSQPAIAAGICLLGVNCSSHKRYLIETLRFAVDQVGFQDLLRGASRGLAALAVTGHTDALVTLLDTGIPSWDPARAPIALAVGKVVLRNTPLALDVLERYHDHDGALELLREAFDMLEEDFAEEQFYVTVRRWHWRAEPDSDTRALAGALIQKLEF